MPKPPETGLIALVCYVPEPLFSTLQQISRSLSSSYDALPHVTVLPPRPLQAPIDVILDHVEAVLSRHSVFAVELTHLSSFAATNLLYLEVERGSDQLRQLHLTLDTGELAFPEEYEYTPHVTVGGPFEANALPGRFRTVDGLWTCRTSSPSFEIQDLVLVWLGAGESQWKPLRSFTLKRDGGRLATAANQT